MRRVNTAGVKGWLLIYVIMLVVIFVSNVGGLLTNLLLAVNYPYEKVIYHVLENAIVNVFIIVTIILISLKKRSAPLIAIITEAFRLGIAVMFFFDSDRRAEDWLYLCAGLLLGVLWIIYFIRSKRVANTFH